MKNLYKIANKAFQQGHTTSAMTGYVSALLKMPELGKVISGNIRRTREQYLKSRNKGEPLKVVVCGWELAHNAAGRAHTLAEIYREITSDVEIVGSIFPRWGREVWEPIRDTSIPIHAFVVESGSFIEQALTLVASHPADVVHLSKPRAPNIFFGIFYKLVWGAKIIVDIDEEELFFVKAETPLSVNEYLHVYPTLPPLDQLSDAHWTRIAVGMAEEFDAVTVSNTALQRRYGGVVIGHARDPNILKPSLELRQKSRQALGIQQEQKVVLFFGTPRPHKGLLEVAKAIQSLNRDDILFVIAGSFGERHLQFKASLQAVAGVNYLFLENQPLSALPKIMAIGDCCVFLQDTNNLISNYQIPAKLSDALAMNIPVITNSTLALEDVIAAGAVKQTTSDNLSNQLEDILDYYAVDQINAGKQYFVEHLTLAVNMVRVRKLLDTTVSAQISSRLPLKMFGLVRHLLDLEHDLCDYHIESNVDAIECEFPSCGSFVPKITKFDQFPNLLGNVHKPTPYGNFEGNKPNKFSILLVSYYFPTRAHAGGLRLLDIYSLLRNRVPGIRIDLLSCYRPSIDWSIDDAYSLFDNVYISENERLTPDCLRDIVGESQAYDVIDLQFHEAAYQANSFATICQKILYTPMESQIMVSYLKFRDIQNNKDPLNINNVIFSNQLAIEEAGFCEDVDQVVCVSRSDAAILRAVTGKRSVSWVETGVSLIEFEDALKPEYNCVPAKNRSKEVLYVAYFGSETNVNALLWFLDNVHALICAEVPEYVLTVVGRGDLTPFEKYRNRTLNLVGEVPKIEPWISKSRVGIAPALGGGGFRGKINQYSILGIPTVASSIALNGLEYQNERDILVADSPEEFATCCIRLLVDEQLNDSIGSAARKLCLVRYSWASQWKKIARFYNIPSYRLDDCRPLVTVVVPSYNHGRYLNERIESILNQTYSNLELIVIDDSSLDNSHQIITKLQRRHGFQYIRNFENSGTPFSAWEKVCHIKTGDYIWICESDDVAEPTFVERAVKALTTNRGAVLFYSSSYIINDQSEFIGHTDDYFHNVWKETRWDSDFVEDGKNELIGYQIYGQTVPNMSSALIDAKAFKSAFNPFLKKFRLTGDWLFIGDVMRHGRVIYSHEPLSRFRKHDVTARVRVKSARSQAEYILTKYSLFLSAGLPILELAKIMHTDCQRFIHEPESWIMLVRELEQISIPLTMQFLKDLQHSIKESPDIINELISRYNSK